MPWQPGKPISKQKSTASRLVNDSVWAHMHTHVHRRMDNWLHLLDGWRNKKLSYRRVTARCVLSVVILPIATQQCQKLLIRQVLTKLMVWSWRFIRRHQYSKTMTVWQWHQQDYMQSSVPHPTQISMPDWILLQARCSSRWQQCQINESGLVNSDRNFKNDSKRYYQTAINYTLPQPSLTWS